MDICKELIARGYFRAEIPPVITGDMLADQYRHMLPVVEKMPDKKNGLPFTWPERYSAAVYGFNRREMLIPNPANQLVVANMIANNWQDIRRYYNESAISKSKHDISVSKARHYHGYNPAVTMTMGREAMKKERLLQMAGHSHILKADISQFFPSIYTHSIAWALHGKDNVKKNLDAPKDKKQHFWGEKLDAAIRNGNGRQTTGIPIGPGTSHIVSEIIMVAIDKIIQEKLNGRLQSGYRYVDDYFLCFDSQEDAEFALAEIQKAVREYELTVNDRKTKILHSIDHEEELWSLQLRAVGAYRPKDTLPDNFKDMLKPPSIPYWELQPSERTWLVQFASEAFALAKKHPKESVMKYALKILRGLPLPPKEEHNRDIPLCEENWDVYESILIRIMTAYPYTADRVAEILRECAAAGYPLNKDKLSDAVSLLIKQHARRDYHTETAWALWLAKVLKLQIADEAMQDLPQSKSSVCALLALDNIVSGLVKTTPDTSPWLARIAEGPHERNWLLAYEAPRREWLGNADHITTCPFFSELKNKCVGFYDESKTIAYAVGDLSYYDE